MEKLKEKAAIELENERLKADQVRQDTDFNERMTTELLEQQERNSSASAELDELRRLNNEQLAEIARLGEVAEAADSRWRAAEIDKLTTDAELKRYRSVETEKSKWEAREDRLVTELTTVKAELTKLRESTARRSHDVAPVVTTRDGTTATTTSGTPRVRLQPVQSPQPQLQPAVHSVQSLLGEVLLPVGGTSPIASSGSVTTIASIDSSLSSTSTVTSDKCNRGRPESNSKSCRSCATLFRTYYPAVGTAPHQIFWR